MAYAEAELNEKRYNYGPPPEFDRSEWLNEKFSLGLEFPNVRVFHTCQLCFVFCYQWFYILASLFCRW